MSLYTDLKDAGCEVESWASDLYVKSTVESRRIVSAAGVRASHFVDDIDHDLWIEVPFAFDPYWERCAAGGVVLPPEVEH